MSPKYYWKSNKYINSVLLLLLHVVISWENGSGSSSQADMSGDTQIARGVSYHATRRWADRAETGSEKRLFAVAEPEQAVVAAHVVSTRRLPRADGLQEQHANRRQERYAHGGDGRGPDDKARRHQVVPVGRAQRWTISEPVQIAGRRHQKNGARGLRLDNTRQRRRV